MNALGRTALYGLLAAAVTATLAFAVFRPLQVLPRVALAPGLALTDQDGRPISSEDLRGELVLYTFSASRCASACEPMTALLRDVQRRLEDAGQAAGPAVRLVTISVDPGRDTPAILAEMAAQAGADPGRWRFATASPNLLKQAVGAGFEVFYGPLDGGGVQVDPLLALVDGWGILRAEYRTAAPDLELVMRDIGLVAAEARNSTGLAHLAYEAAHLFLCYPR